MKNAQKADRFNLSSLLGDLQKGIFVIPDFQREFEWRPWDVRDLIKSIFLDYYIGTLLLWKGKEENFRALDCEPMYGFQGNSKPDYIVLDGQQRLTALYYACFAPDINFPKRKNPFFFYIDIKKYLAEEDDEAFAYDVKSKKWRTLLADKTEQFKQHIFPISILGAGIMEFVEWVKGYENYWKEEASSAAAIGDQDLAGLAQQAAKGAEFFSKHLLELQQDYQISYIELDKEIGVEKVCDIFTQINSKGIRLDIFDLLNALLKPKEIQLKKLWREAAKRLEFAETEKMNVYVLQVMSILLQAYCSPKYLYFLIPNQPKTIRHPDGSFEKKILIDSEAAFKKSWDDAVDFIEDVIQVLKNPRDYGVVSSNFLPYPSIIPAFAALRAYVKNGQIASRPDALRKLRKWYWASIFGNRYSSSVESTSAQDFGVMKKWFENDEEKPSFVREFEANFRNQDLARENKKGAAIYNAVFNLLVIRGAKDLDTFELPEYASLDDHHIVPASWGREHVGTDIHSILNRTPLTPTTNRNIINDKLPNQYLKEMFSQHKADDVWEVLESHLISRKAAEILMRDNFEPDDYYEFIDERQKTILAGIETLLIKERIDLSPDLRRLDEEIEKVELALRESIVSAVGEDEFLLPGWVKNAVEPRLTKAAKNPGFDQGYYETPKGMVEYFDLQHCKEVIVSKPYWDKFSGRYPNKEALAQKFNQLAELRNTIRHSRTATEIVRMEGEAALLWFREALK
ncbi:MAG: DUF262 domain-containing protein [Proteobacteria bacterium]|nr:DUF262 domain-containing protein [Pseudomonadota bacterium]MBU1714504.1 DUF262 domain-containing protein [Pseudomonadota bacterium]